MRWFDEIGSTQDQARSWAIEGAPDRALVVAERQTHGRGRWGRRWEGGDGRSLLATWILHIPEIGSAGLVGGAAAAGLCRAIVDETGVNARTKWPNDVWTHGGKCAGVLIERTAGVNGPYLIGFGVNVNQTAAELPESTDPPAVSLRMVTGREWDREALLARIVRGIDGTLRQAAQDLPRFLETWSRLESTLGKSVVLRQSAEPVEGMAVQLYPDGSLGVEVEGAERQVAWGEVTVRPVRKS